MKRDPERVDLAAQVEAVIGEVLAEPAQPDADADLYDGLTGEGPALPDPEADALIAEALAEPCARHPERPALACPECEAEVLADWNALDG